MTYPPQPGQPYGQQPDPYGGYPQSGGFQQPSPWQQPGQPQAGQPQSGQQYPNPPYGGQQAQYPQQPSQQPQYPGQFPSQFPGQQYPGYSQGFGGPPAPPRKSKKGLWAGISAVVVLLIAFGVTGFLAPGFLVSGTKSDTADGAAQALVAGLNSKDTAALTALKCGDATTTVGQAIDEVGKLTKVTLHGAAIRVSDTEYTADLDVTTTGKPSPYLSTFGQEGGKWCWKDIGHGSSSDSTSAPQSGSPATI
jgi:hypothetical protein